jgi:hypothetical protein
MLLIDVLCHAARPLRLSLALAAVSLPAFAGQINILYNYGNPAGCKNLADGDYTDESMFYLTPEGFSSYVTSCEFLQALRPKDDSYVVTTICGHEGDGALTIEMYRIHKATDGADAYEIFNDTGELWQRVEPCL